ncbi:hypothetical protein EV672_102137 [Aquabacterium commune]|uniref:Uncharacterized protein n=1 Tax=Aquabacterium commune TaxID=70586 RepID=A0A4V3CWC3_9BURK|nr:hypothetical protein [Aquabacterium commune]TDP85788.1 hypothetical protein EV672_102137 [Aquabacterium commune]
MSATASRIDRVRVVVAPGTQASAWTPRLRHALAHWLDTAEAQRHDLPSDAIVLIRQVKTSWRAVQQAGQATVQPPSLSAALHSAQHGLALSGAPAGAGCPAVWFGNEAEVLAGLARDALSGSLAQRWWWRQLVGRPVHDEVVQQRWVASPRHVPLALSLLHTERQDTPWLRHMDAGHREAMLQALASAFPTDAAVLAWVRHGVTLPQGPNDGDAAWRLARLCAALVHRPHDAAHGGNFLTRHAQALGHASHASPTLHAGGTDGARAPDDIGGTHASAWTRTPPPAGTWGAQTHLDTIEAGGAGGAAGPTPDAVGPTAQHASRAHASQGGTGHGHATDHARAQHRDNAPGRTVHDALTAGAQPQTPSPSPAHSLAHSLAHPPPPSSTLGRADIQTPLAPTSADAPAPHTPDLSSQRSAAPSREDGAQALDHAAHPPADDAPQTHRSSTHHPRPLADRDPARVATTGALPRAASRTDTPHAGLFFLLNAAIGLGWYGDFTQPQHQGLDASPWQFLRAAGQALLGHRWHDDPLHGWLMAMDPNPVPSAELRPLWPKLRTRLSLAMGLPRTQAVQLTVRLPGQVRLRPGRVDVHAPLAQLPLAVRMAGLDRDIGWLPAAGLDIRFHFEAGTP